MVGNTWKIYGNEKNSELFPSKYAIPFYKAHRTLKNSESSLSILQALGLRNIQSPHGLSPPPSNTAYWRGVTLLTVSSIQALELGEITISPPPNRFWGLEKFRASSSFEYSLLAKHRAKRSARWRHETYLYFLAQPIKKYVRNMKSSYFILVFFQCRSVTSFLAVQLAL